MTGPRESRTATPSLRLRVALMTLGLLTILVIALGVTIDGVVGSQARRDLHDRLVAATTRADALATAGTPPTQVVAQISGGGIRARLVTATGDSYGDPAVPPDAPDTEPAPPAPPRPPPGGPPPPGERPPPPPLPPGSTATVVEHRLPTGDRVVLVADTTATTALLRQLRIVIVVSAVLVLLVAAVAMTLLVRTAMRPLNRLTDVADSITAGDRGRRISPDRPTTELGCAASAFDTMLDALEQSEQRARVAAATAARAEATTLRFLADAAHELRTPIAGIHAGAQQLAATATQSGDDPAAASQRRRAELVLTEARRAGRLVNDMLDLTRIDAGAELDLQRCDLVDLVEAEGERTRLLAPGLTVQRTGDDRVPVVADPMRVAQILANLADNARRHTPAGGSLTIDVEHIGATAQVTVTDTGDGVPEGQRENIFERLVRLDEARTRDRAGAGLGLPIARALARAHGGDLICETHSPGARFALTLPLAEPSP